MPNVHFAIYTLFLYSAFAYQPMTNAITIQSKTDIIPIVNFEFP